MRLPLELNWHFLQAVHCIGWNNCSEVKQTPSRTIVFFPISVFQLYPGLKMSFKHNSVRKNLILNACFCWDSGISLREMDKKFKFVDSLVIETLIWTLFFVTSKYSDYTQYYMMLLEASRNKASLCREKSKGVRRKGYAAFVKFVRLFCIFVYH